MQIIPLTGEARNLISRLDPVYNTYSEMTPSEQEFLTALVQKYKPKKAVEIGVAAGSSAVLLLNALAEIPDATLASVEYLDHWYRDVNIRPGFVVDHYPELKKKWTLHSGALVSEFADQIGDGIDFCFIDAAHLVPGEIVDFLCILPYLKENAVVALHDINLHTWDMFPNSNVNNLLVSAMSGEKLVPETFEKRFFHNTMKIDIDMSFPNIGAVVLDSNQKDRVWDIFNLLTQQWHYLPTEKDLNDIRRAISRHYGARYLEHFNTVVLNQIRRLQARGYQMPQPDNEQCADTTKTSGVSVSIQVSKPQDRNRMVWRYRRYKLLSKICVGDARKRYKKKRQQLKYALKARS